MNKHEVIQVRPVIMAGGSGTRLWPLSRAIFPKQFMAFIGAETLFQQTVMRMASIANQGIAVTAPCVVCNEEHRFLVVDQLREINTEVSALLLEPMGRNTAPAVTLAALEAMEVNADPILVVTPSDQTVTDMKEFTAVLQRAVFAAQDGSIVVLGITPTTPETGFGYIQTEALTQSCGSHQVMRFVEKPDQSTAEEYLAEGSYFWNAGMFVLRASTWLKAIDFFRPDICAATRAAWKLKKQDGMFIRPDKLGWEAIPGESVDYAVIEKLGVAVLKDSAQTTKFVIPLKMIALNAGWSDLGAWDAVWQISSKDENGNATVGDALFQNTTNTHVHSTSRLVAAVGLNNLVIVETPDAVLVADRNQSQGVKHIVSQLQKANRTEGGLHRRVHRPWGWYDSIDSGPRFQVKRILVKPGFSLSLQRHHHRAEHWIVVSGTAEVTLGEKVLLLTENQSIYIPLGEVHRLSNPGKLPLELIEVQSGSYLGEDDIVRLQDNFGRV